MIWSGIFSHTTIWRKVKRIISLPFPILFNILDKWIKIKLETYPCLWAQYYHQPSDMPILQWNVQLYMLIMCFSCFGINTSDDLFSFLYLLVTWYWCCFPELDPQSCTLLLSCRLWVGGWCQAIIQMADHEPKWGSYFESVILPARWTPFLLILQKVTPHCSGNKRFYFMPTPYSPCVSIYSQKWLLQLSVPPSFQCIL